MTDLSLVIPCYNEEEIFNESITKIVNHLNTLGIEYEIILVDDKSSDKTRKLIESLENKKISHIFHETNKGRGKTVTDGIKKSKGAVVGYIDIDLEITEENIGKHFKSIKSGNDVSYADRKTNFSFRIIPRILLHEAYIAFTRLSLGTPFRDMNAGCKFFNREKIIPILEQIQDPHWFWDTEILVRSHYAGLQIEKIPAIYTRNFKKKSTVKVFSDSVYFVKKILEFKKQLREIK